MHRHTLRVLAAAAALLAGYGCTDLAAPASSTPSAASLEKLTRAPSLSQPQFNTAGWTDRVSGVIGPEGGVLSLSGGHRVAFPGGAVAEPTRITMRAHAEYVGVELEPRGLVFPAGREPVLTISVEGVDIARYQTLNIVRINGAGQILEVLPTRVGGAGMTAPIGVLSGSLVGSGNRSGG